MYLDQLTGVQCTHTRSIVSPANDIEPPGPTLNGSSLRSNQSEIDSRTGALHALHDPEKSRLDVHLSEERGKVAHETSNRNPATWLPGIMNTESLSHWNQDELEDPRGDLRCPYKACSHVSRNRSEHKKHLSRHSKPHKCGHCNHSFSTHNDVERHMKSVHKIAPRNGTDRSFRCVAPNCTKSEKIWPRLDNFRQHCHRIHKDYDIDELVRE